MVNLHKLFTHKKKNTWKNRPNLPAGSAYNLTFKAPSVNKSRIVGVSGGPEKKKWWHRFTRKAKAHSQSQNKGPLAKNTNGPNYSSLKSVNSVPRNHYKNFLRNFGLKNEPKITRKVANNENLLTFPSEPLNLKYPFEYPASNSNTKQEKIFKSKFVDLINYIHVLGNYPKNRGLISDIKHLMRELTDIRRLNENELELLEKTDIQRLIPSWWEVKY